MKQLIDGEQDAAEDDTPAEIDFSKAARGRYSTRQKTENAGGDETKE
jgi:hypothetical protein